MHSNNEPLCERKCSENALKSDFKLIVEEEDFSSDSDTPLKTQNLPARIWTRKIKKWCTPWFLICMCGWQLFFYFIGNDCVYQRLMLKPEHHVNQLWRYITYTLLHSDLIHLWLNICLQCMIGFILECEQGHWRVAFIYFAGGISGSLATALMQPQLSLLGASAAVYALLMSHVPHLLKNFPHLRHRFLRIVALMVLCVSDFAFTLFHFLVNHNLDPRICFEAHVAGAAAGLFFGSLAFKRAGPEGAE